MPKVVLAQQKIIVGSTNLSGMCRVVHVGNKVEKLDGTTFGCATKVGVAGLGDPEISFEGFHEAGSGLLDPERWDAVLASGDEVMTVLQKTAVAGDPAVFMNAAQASFEGFPGEVGKIVPFKGSVMGRGALYRGTNLKHGTVSSGAGGTALNLGAVGAAQTLYAAINVTAASGLSGLIGIVMSDDTEAFPSGLARITFTGRSTKGSELLSIAGPITDTWWRAIWSISAGTAEITMVMAIV